MVLGTHFSGLPFLALRIIRQEVLSRLK